MHYIKFTTYEDGSYYETPYRSVIEGKRTMERGLYNDYQVIDVVYKQTYSGGVEITSCYVGPKDDGIIIWEKGMDLPPASEDLEKVFSY